MNTWKNLDFPCYNKKESTKSALFFIMGNMDLVWITTGQNQLLRLSQRFPKWAYIQFLKVFSLHRTYVFQEIQGKNKGAMPPIYSLVLFLIDIR